MYKRKVKGNICMKEHSLNINEMCRAAGRSDRADKARGGCLGVRAPRDTGRNLIQSQCASRLRAPISRLVCILHWWNIKHPIVSCKFPSFFFLSV